MLLCVVIYQQIELRHLQRLLQDCGGVRYEIRKFKKSRLEAGCDTAAVIRWYESLPRREKLRLK